MSEKFLNQTGLNYYHNRAKTQFENKIEKVKVNGAEQTIDTTDKSVNIVMPSLYDATDSRFEIISQKNGTPHGHKTTISADKTDEDKVTIVHNIMDFKSGQVALEFTRDLATTDYVDANGGKIDKIKVNGTAQTITNKEVELKVPEMEFETKTEEGETWTSGIKIKNNGSNSSYLEIKQNETNGNLVDVFITNNTIDIPHTLVDKYYVDNSFRTEQQVRDAIDGALAGVTGMEFVLVDTLPAMGEKGKIYLVPNSSAGSNIKDEYIWITLPPGNGVDESYFEKIGSTDIDLSNYYNDTNLVAITTAEIDALFA